jgi:hypothetical protein
MRAVTVPPLSLSFFDLPKFLPLLVGKSNRDLVVRFHYDFMNKSAGVAPHLPELAGRFIDDRRHFGRLFRCQAELRAESLLHPVTHSARAMNLRDKVPSVPSPESSASDATSDEDKKKSGNKFPLQRAVHGESPSWIAVSAIANSFVKS